MMVMIISITAGYDFPNAESPCPPQILYDEIGHYSSPSVRRTMSYSALETMRQSHTLSETSVMSNVSEIISAKKAHVKVDRECKRIAMLQIRPACEALSLYDVFICNCDCLKSINRSNGSWVRLQQMFWLCGRICMHKDHNMPKNGVAMRFRRGCLHYFPKILPPRFSQRPRSVSPGPLQFQCSVGRILKKPLSASFGWLFLGRIADDWQRTKRISSEETLEKFLQGFLHVCHLRCD